MDDEQWLIFHPADGYGEQINALYAELMGAPDAFMVLTLDLAEIMDLTMVDAWRINRFPIHEVDNRLSENARILHSMVRVLTQHPHWFKAFAGLEEGQAKLLQLGITSKECLASWAPPTQLINNKVLADKDSESLFF